MWKLDGGEWEERGGACVQEWGYLVKLFGILSKGMVW